MGTSLFLQKWSSAHGTESRKGGLSGEQRSRAVDKSCGVFYSTVVLLTLARSRCPLLKWGWYFSSFEECCDNKISWYWAIGLSRARRRQQRLWSGPFPQEPCLLGSEPDCKHGDIWPHSPQTYAIVRWKSGSINVPEKRTMGQSLHHFPCFLETLSLEGIHVLPFYILSSVFVIWMSY